MSSSGDALRELFDIRLEVSAPEASRLLLEGRLPSNVYVVGSLDLSGTKITTLPEGLYVKGHLNLCRTKLLSLPKNLHVRGTLNLCKISLEGLPEGLVVEHDLWLLGTNVSDLPEDIRVGRNLFLSQKLEGKKPLGVRGRLYLKYNF